MKHKSCQSWKSWKVATSSSNCHLPAPPTRKLRTTGADFNAKHSTFLWVRVSLSSKSRLGVSRGRAMGKGRDRVWVRVRVGVGVRIWVRVMGVMSQPQSLG